MIRPDLSTVAAIADLRVRARRHLPRPVFDFLDGAAADEQTLRDNERAFSDYGLLPRIGVDVSSRTLSTRVLGAPSALPFGLSPVGFSGLFRPRGEILAARAAAAAGIPYCLSTLSVASIEEIARAIPDGDKWFQLYFLKDKDLLSRFLTRIRDSGFRVLCLTVDLPAAGRRDRDTRNAFTVPVQPGPRMAWHFARHPRWTVAALRAPVTFGNFQETPGVGGFGSLARHIGSLFDPSADWDAISRIRDQWAGPMLLKGVLHPADAARAAALGIDAISVSNHGGRQLDGAPSALDALVAIREASGDMDLMLDGGVRRGTDIVKARALGASFVLIGRAFAYGLAAAGQPGVEKAIDILSAEIDNALTLLGVPDIADLGPAHVWKRNGDRP